MAASYRLAGVAQTGAGIVHALAFAFEAFVALGGGFFGGAALVGDLADALARLVCLGAVLGAGLALGPCVCGMDGECQAQGKCAGTKGVMGCAVPGHGRWGGEGRGAQCSYNRPVLHGARRTSGLVPASGASKSKVHRLFPGSRAVHF